MPRRAQRLCPRCHQPYTGRCPNCTVEHTNDGRRPTFHQRGYTREHQQRFRRQVLDRDPTCTCHGCTRCTIAGVRCLEPSTQADHHPKTRRQLEHDGEDPNDPEHGRGLCAPCHSHHTATTSRRRGDGTTGTTGPRR